VTAQPARPPQRDAILDALRTELLARDWSEVTLSDVARTAGISRQTIYNEFGSRRGLAEGYALRMADRMVEHIDDAIGANREDLYAAFLTGFRIFFAESAADPLVISLLSGQAKPDLLQIITTHSGPIITRSAQRLAGALRRNWPDAGAADAGVLARAIVRLALSYVSMPAEPGSAADHDIAADLARLLTPFAERYAAG